MRLVGENIVLREPHIRDSDLLMIWENSEVAVKVSSHEGGYSRKEMIAYIQGIKDIYLDKQLRFMISRGNSPIGTLDLFDVDFDSSSASIGILIAEQEDRNCGLGSESLSLIIYYCAETLGLGFLNAQIQKDNLASISFFRKMGFIESCSDDQTISMQLDLSQFP